MFSTHLPNVHVVSQEKRPFNGSVPPTSDENEK